MAHPRIIDNDRVDLAETLKELCQKHDELRLRPVISA